MGIATWHEVKPTQRAKPRKPTLDEMGPGTESKIFQPTNSRQSGPEFSGRATCRPSPRSSGGAPGHRGGWKKSDRSAVGQTIRKSSPCAAA